MSKKKWQTKPSPEKYEKSNLAINGTFDEAVQVFFKKPDKAKAQ